jgi:hypothetical protein
LCWADVVVGSNGNSNGRIRHFIDGIAPRRRVVIDFSDCAFYRSGNSGGAISGQIWLMETTGIVEIHLTKSSGVASTGGGVKTLGVNNFNVQWELQHMIRNGTAWQTSQYLKPGDSFQVKLTKYEWTPAAFSLNDSH